MTYITKHADAQGNVIHLFYPSSPKSSEVLRFLNHQIGRALEDRDIYIYTG